MADVISRTAFGEIMHGAAHGKKNTPAALEMAEILTAHVWGAKNIPAALVGADALTTRIAGSKNVQAILTVSEVLTSMPDATSQTTERTTVQLTIPPGAEPRICSELFIVLLDGENVLHTQYGDWINISRDLLRIIEESTRNISEQQKINAVWYLYFSLPYKGPKNEYCKPFYFRKNWVLDECDYRNQFEYGWEQKSLLSALFSVAAFMGNKHGGLPVAVIA